MSNLMMEVRGTIAYQISSTGIIRKSSSIKRNSLRGTSLCVSRIELEEENTIVGKMDCGIQLIKRKKSETLSQRSKGHHRISKYTHNDISEGKEKTKLQNIVKKIRTKTQRYRQLLGYTHGKLSRFQGQ